ncbi:uncharacterized protein LOC109719242 [Ananas comosus]|uniref:Uncharacterized protein LOC109719242 n=1 Tax=Ananas comosus TaxID=4615 RepID=A0A6P5FZ99_ANACO|nr:uncharacterized protein LOC109719242 [Ananas comosus]
MGVQVAGPCLHWSQLFPAAPSASQTLASVFASICSAKRYGPIYGSDASLAHHHVAEHRSPFLGGSRLSRTRSSEIFRPRGSRGREGQLRRAVSAGLEHLDDDDDDDDDDKRIREQSADSLGDDDRKRDAEIGGGSRDAGDAAAAAASGSPFSGTARPAIWPDEPPDWPDRDALSIVAANSGPLPLPLRIIMQKKQQQQRWEEDFFRDAGESALSSVKRAFSSMVFIIRELHSFTLHMRELLFLEDLRGILARVHHEMHASFVWLFQHIFSCTPTLMLFLMLLLADFTVHSMAHTVASAAAAPPRDPTPRSAAVMPVESPPQTKRQRFASASVKSFSVGRTAEVGGSGGGGGGGGKVRPVAGSSDEGRSDGYRESRTIVPEGISNVPATLPEEKRVEKDASEAEEEDESVVWNRVVEEASGMRARVMHESLMDPTVLKRLVAPVAVEFEGDDGSTAHFRTELMYQQALSAEPDNSLLVSNFAQFLYLVLRDHDRAEYYFKKAVRIEPADAEALSRYATFLWVARKDLEAAEETYLEAIAADPGNSFYAANYAHFLWNTGGEDTCYPLDTDEA